MEIGLSSVVNSILASLGVAVITTIVTAIYKCIRGGYYDRKKWRKNEIEQKLYPVLGKERLDLVKSKYFIPTYGQYKAPHDLMEFSGQANCERIPLVSWFLSDILKSDYMGKGRFLILGGSGMGKSTFSTELFYKYILKYNKKTIPFPIQILFLGKSNVIDRIYELSRDNDAYKTILILDALDENLEAAKNIEAFWEKLNEVVDGFKFVIITGRAQFYNNENSIVLDLIESQGEENKLSEYSKLYISPLVKEDVENYLVNKFKKNTEDFRNAICLVDKCKDLMYRPMILAFIDDLLNIDRYSAATIVDIYNMIINAWLKRECRSQHHSRNRIKVADLYDFSKKLAMFIYEKWEKTGEAFITGEEYQCFIKDNGYENNPYSFKKRSLINRTSDGNIKFSHQSFLEFFIAISIFEYPGRYFAVHGNLDMTKIFVGVINQSLMNEWSYDFIDYFDINDNYDFSDIRLRSILDSQFENEIPCLDDVARERSYYQILYRFWQEAAGAIIPSKNKVVKIATQETSVVNKMQIVNNLNSAKEIQDMIYDLVDCTQRAFIEECDKSQRLCVIKQLLEKIAKKIEIASNVCSLDSKKRETRLIYPNFFEYKDSITDNMLSNNTFIIGRGLYNVESVVKLINTIIDKRHGIRGIYVINDANNIEDSIKFVDVLTECLLARENWDKLDVHIIIKFNIQGNLITYVCDRLSLRYTKIQREKCVYKMFDIAKGVYTG